MSHLLVIGGSDERISASLRARELDPSTEVTMVVADAYPNFSICGIPFFLSGETPDWRSSPTAPERNRGERAPSSVRHACARIDAATRP